MEERQVTRMGGNIITLLGPEIRAGDRAPDFMLLDSDLFPKYPEDFEGKIKLISVIPSIETRVCNLQTCRFNEEAEKLSEDVAVLSVSMDLPFTLKRWTEESGLNRIITLSDHRDASFGLAYGVLIKELRLLNRAIFVIDQKDIVKYVEVVEENNNPPDFDRALDAVRELEQ